MRKSLRHILGAGAATAALLSASGAFAADQDSTLAEIQALKAQLAALQSHIDDLETQVGDLKESSAAAVQAVREDALANTVTLNNGRPTFTSADGKFSASLRGVLQLDTAQYFQDSDLPPTVTNGDLNSGTNIRRGRLGLEGKVFGDFDYNILLDFGGSGTDGNTTLHELWLQYSAFKPFKFRVGVFPPNLGLEDAASTNGSLFPERPSSAEVARGLAGADKRIAAQALANGDRWLAAVAVTGAKTTDSATFDEQLGYTARLAGVPLRGYDWMVHTGVNASYVQRPPQSSAGGPTNITLQDRPELRVDGTSLISTGAINANSAYHYGVELAAQKKNFLIQGEYFHYSIDRRDPVAPGVSDPDFNGWYVEGGWVITGEARKYNTGTAGFDAPSITNNFNPKDGKWGAWELAARYSELDLNYNELALIGGDRVRGGEQKIWTLGVNWFVNPVVRFSLDYLNVDIDRLASGSLAQAGQSYSAVNLRSQFAF